MKCECCFKVGLSLTPKWLRDTVTHKLEEFMLCDECLRDLEGRPEIVANGGEEDAKGLESH